MTADTINMALNIVAIVGWVVVAYLVWRNREEIQASKVAINHIPQYIAPAEAMLDRVLKQGERVAVLLENSGDFLEQYKILQRDYAILKRQTDSLEYRLGVVEGQKVALTDTLARQVAVADQQWTLLRRQETTIGDQHTTIEALRKLVEELTRALPDRKAGEQ